MKKKVTHLQLLESKKSNMRGDHLTPNK
jgi:hypothetical protein